MDLVVIDYTPRSLNFRSIDRTPGQNNSCLWKLKTEDLLELTRGDRGLALDSVSVRIATFIKVTRTFPAEQLL